VEILFLNSDLTGTSFDLWQKIAEQGFNLLLLAIAVYWMHNKNKVLEKKIESQQERIEELHREMLEYERTDNRELTKVLKDVTASVNKFSAALDQIVKNNKS
jgi:septal ring factor EnvC (AmiA/AmiB activator)